MPTNNEIKKLNRMFVDAGLGTNPYNESLYRWQRAGSHFMPVIKTDGFGKNLIQYVQKPILDDLGRQVCKTKTVTRPIDDAGNFEDEVIEEPQFILVPHPVIKHEKTAFWLDDEQWVVARWVITSKADWDSAYQGLLPWPHRGYWWPGNICTLNGEVPHVGITDQAIQGLLQHRTMSADDWIRQTEEGLALQQKHVESKQDAIIRDAMTAFGNARPGKRGNHVSFGGV